MLFLKRHQGDLMYGHYRSPWHRQEASLHLNRVHRTLQSVWRWYLGLLLLQPLCLKCTWAMAKCSSGRKRQNSHTLPCLPHPALISRVMLFAAILLWKRKHVGCFPSCRCVWIKWQSQGTPLLGARRARPAPSLHRAGARSARLAPLQGRGLSHLLCLCLSPASLKGHGPACIAATHHTAVWQIWPECACSDPTPLGALAVPGQGMGRVSGWEKENVELWAEIAPKTHLFSELCWALLSLQIS